jgi:hypothetical protein
VTFRKKYFAGLTFGISMGPFCQESVTFPYLFFKDGSMTIACGATRAMTPAERFRFKAFEDKLSFSLMCSADRDLAISISLHKYDSQD